MIINLNRLNKKKVLIIGDILLDKYINVIPKKISEESPLIVYNYEKEHFYLGGATNVAKYLASFGINVDIMGVIGDDIEGNIVIDLLKKSKISTNYIIKNKKFKTILKNRYYSNDNKQIMRVDREEIIDIENIVLNKLNLIKKDYDLIIISDYRKGVITNKVLQKIIKLSNNTKIICDPKDDNVNYHELFILKPNLKETLNIIKSLKEEDLIKYKEKNKIENLVITKGEKGIELIDSNNKITYIEAIKNKVYDITGAGDTVLSYLALSYLNNINIIDACKISNYAAAIKVGKFGTEIVKLNEVLPKFKNKLIKKEEAKSYFNIFKDKKIVFTNGCFDILHSGHIHLLKSAKKMGDILVVGLNSDSSIKKLKGISRPIIEEQERIEILSSLECVDYIVLFNELTPLNIIKLIKPNILVKGSDYKDKEIVGKKEVLELGGKVVLVDIIKGKSTTNIVNKMKE